MSEIHDHDRGLSHDLPIIVRRGLGRRSVLALFGGVSPVALAGCGTDGTSATSIVSVTEGEIPEETTGPYPAAGSNGLVGAAVYLWHCNRAGEYSMYSDAVKDQNYLRGVQATDAKGYVEFTSIFPGAYSGRWPHLHFEVYPSLDDATSASNKLRTSQMALPEEVCKQVYEADGYDASVANLSQSSLSSDNVFSDGYSLQMAKVTGSNDEGYLATLNVPV
jgi:hypothetical protein